MSRKTMIVLGVLLAMVLASALWRWSGLRSPAYVERADPGDARLVERGRAVYVQQCAACHGVNLEGQPNWRKRLPSGRLPAPPHDVGGHTWHHADEVLFDLTKFGLVPGRTAPAGYQSDMPGFADRLNDDEIWAVLAYIKSTWPPKALQAQREITARYRDAQSAAR